MDGDGGEGGDGGDDHDNDQGGAASASVTAAATTLASLSSMPAESQGSTPGAPVAAKKLTMTFTEFRKVSAMLVEHLRHIELHAQESPESMETDSSGSLRQQALIDWYIQQRASELQSEEEAVFHARLVRAVIKRLVDKDQVLLAMAVRCFLLPLSGMFRCSSIYFAVFFRIRSIRMKVSDSCRYIRTTKCHNQNAICSVVFPNSVVHSLSLTCQ
jgi:hypothetical protein